MSLLLPPGISDRASALIVEGCLRGFADALGGNYDERRQSPNYWDNPKRRRVRAVVWHITDGGFTGSMDWLCNPESEASANDLINRDGRVWNLVPGRLAPWTNGRLCKPNTNYAIPAQAAAQGVNPNWWSYTIENVGTSTWGKSGALSQAQIASLVLRTAQACTEYRLTADQEHILRHAHFDSCDRAGCPGFSPSEMIDWTMAVAAVCKAWRGW
jgi:N-acetylmuramoyl-L-alanine amidase